MTHLCHPGSAAGAIRDGTESHAEARTARRDDPGQRVRRPVARLSLAVVRAVSSRMSRPGSPLRVGRDDKEGARRRVALQLHCFSRAESHSAAETAFIKESLFIRCRDAPKFRVSMRKTHELDDDVPVDAAPFLRLGVPVGQAHIPVLILQPL